VNKPAVSVAKMQRMRRAIERDGLPFRGYRHYPDGSVEALVGEPPLTANTDAAPSSDPLDAELAQWVAKHGYDRP
jgi:hypothetical protein